MTKYYKFQHRFKIHNTLLSRRNLTQNYFGLNSANTDIFKTSSGRLQKVTMCYDQTRRCHDVWKKTLDLRCLEDVWLTLSWRRPIYEVVKTSDLRRLQDNLRPLENVWFTTSSGRLIYDVLKTSDLRCLEDVQFTTSWRRLISDVLKTSVKRHLCSNVVATSIQRRKKWLFLILHCLKYSENFKCSSLS